MIDTHCHIHDSQYNLDAKAVLNGAREAGVETLVCIGTTAEDSVRAADFAAEHSVWAAVAQHPHEAKDFGSTQKSTLKDLVEHERVVAIGECGLDYYYNHSPREQQKAMLRWHLELAQNHDLPLLFHVRDAFGDFWEIFDEFNAKSQLRGLIHCFTNGTRVLDQALERGLLVAFNGIHTFTKDQAQLDAVKAAPLDKIVLETDAPFLTPHPFRGKVNEPKYVAEVGKFIAELRGESFEAVAAQTTANARNLLRI